MTTKSSKWYEENGDIYNEKRRSKYAEDPQYAEAIRTKAREAKRDKMAARDGKVPRTWKGQELLVNRIGDVAEVCGTTIAALRALETEGVIPKPVFGGAQRVYTDNQVELIRELIDDIQAANGSPSSIVAAKNNRKLYIKSRWMLNL